MKSLLKHTIFNAISLYLLTMFLQGVKIEGGIPIFIFSGFLLSLLFKICKPILNLLSIPLNLVSLGLFSFLVNTLLLYVLTIFVPNINITAFTFPGFMFAGFVVPSMYFNTFFAHIVAAGTLAVIINFFDWLVRKH